MAFSIASQRSSTQARRQADPRTRTRIGRSIVVAPSATYQEFQAKQDSSTRQVRASAASFSPPRPPALATLVPFVEVWATQLQQLFAAPAKEAWEDEFSMLQNEHDEHKVMYHSHIAERMAEQ